jgi:hypothetical protein
MIVYLFSVDPVQVLRFARLDSALIVPPLGWGQMATWFPRDVVLAESAAVVFFVFTFLTLIGLWTRISVALAVFAGFYLLTVPQLFGKINHSHFLVQFGLLLACSPSGDALSIDALIAKRRGCGIPALATSRRYAAPLQAVMVLMGIYYFFPGAWKVIHLGLDWFRPSHLRAVIETTIAVGTPTHFQLWILHQSALLSIGAFFTIVFEMGWILLVIPRRTRPLVIAMGLLFHNMTSLMMNISFWGLQLCYVALVNWGGVVIFLSRHFRSVKTATEQWSRAIKDDGRSQTLGRAFPWLAGFLIVAMVLAGIGHAVNSWPIACFPTFDGPSAAPLQTILVLEVHTREGTILDEPLSYDRALQANYRWEIWQIMTRAEGCTDNFESEARARALLGLWQGVHPKIDAASATLYCDTYEGNIDSLHRTGHLQIRRVGVQAMAAN